jgi:hypothetical protein
VKFADGDFPLRRMLNLEPDALYRQVLD